MSALDQGTDDCGKGTESGLGRCAQQGSQGKARCAAAAQGTGTRAGGGCWRQQWLCRALAAGGGMI